MVFCVCRLWLQEVLLVRHSRRYSSSLFDIPNDTISFAVLRTCLSLVLAYAVPFVPEIWQIIIVQYSAHTGYEGTIAVPLTHDSSESGPKY